MYLCLYIYIYIWVSAKLTQCKNNTKSIRAALVPFVLPAAVLPDGFVWLEAGFDKCCFFPAWVWNRRFGKLEKKQSWISCQENIKASCFVMTDPRTSKKYRVFLTFRGRSSLRPQRQLLDPYRPRSLRRKVHWTNQGRLRITDSQQ